MLFPFFQWCEATTIGNAIRSSLWAFAAIESVHLLGLAAIGGAVLVVDLRLLGLGLRRQSIAEVARSAYPWFVGSLIVMLVTGVALFLSEAVKCYYSTPLGEDVIARAGDDVQLHGPPENHAGRRIARPANLVQGGCACLVVVMVRRWRRRALDRVFRIGNPEF